MLNPIWLKTFVVLAQTGHFTRAAEKLFMTQPGVSQHIHKLELACGFSLIIRDKKSFELTEQGRLVLGYARQLEKNESELIDKLSFDDPYSGVCNLACSGALALTLYPKLLDFQVRYPSLFIHLKASPNDQILTEILEGVVDIGLVTERPNKSLFDIEVLGQEELCLVLPGGYQFTGNIADALSDLGLISHPDIEHYLSLYFNQCGELSLNSLLIADLPRIGFVNQISQILEPLTKGLGFTVLPLTAVKSFHSHHLLNIYKPNEAVIEPLYQIKKKNRPLPERYKSLTHLIGGVLLGFNRENIE